MISRIAMKIYMSKTLSKGFPLLLSLLVAMMIVGCSSPEMDSPTSPDSIDEDPPNPDVTETAEVLADCFLYFHLSAWQDLNGDGERQEGEPPLEGVEFSLDGMYANSIAGGKGITDENGDVTIDAWSPGGCIGDYVITASTPDGYQASTDTVVTVSEDEIVTDHEFGFIPVKEN